MNNNIHRNRFMNEKTKKNNESASKSDTFSYKNTKKKKLKI